MSNSYSRRRFSQALLSSAALSGAGAGTLLAPLAGAARPALAVPESLREVLNIAQLDQLARQQLMPAAYHFIVGAADDGSTKRANREAFAAVQIRPRRLVDVSAVDTSVELFGQRYASPLVLAPVGDQQQLHPDGELATGRAAAASGQLMIAAMLSNYALPDIASTGVSTWLQLYPSPNRELLLALLRAAEGAGSQAVVLTVDSATRGNHEAARWFAKRRDPDVPRTSRPLGNLADFAGRKPIGDAAFTWADVDWLREQTALPLVLKGIVTAEDARLCRRAAVDGVIVSNHGGRQEGSGRGTLAVLPEVADVLGGRMPILLDGGVRRGSDVFKALALGATAVGIGRPYLWGLGAGGEDGVRKCLQILQAELVRTMQLAGTPALSDIGPAAVYTGAAGVG